MPDPLPPLVDDRSAILRQISELGESKKESTCRCWLMLFTREEKAQVETRQPTTLATTRLKFLFLAARIWRHAGRVGVSSGDHYADKSLFQRLMNRLQAVSETEDGSVPVIAAPLRC
jgi:hypothetical protein